MKIALVTRSLRCGGAERQLCVLAEALHRRGIPVHVVAWYAGGAFAATLERAGVPLHVVGKESRFHVAGFLCGLVRTIAAIDPDVVYSMLPGPNLIAGLVKPILGNRRWVWGIRTAGVQTPYCSPLDRWLYRFERALTRLPDSIIVNSRAGAEPLLARLGSGRVRVVPNGIDTDVFRPDPAGGEALRRSWGLTSEVPLIGRIGRTDAAKDPVTFARAVARLGAPWCHARLVFVGRVCDRERAALEACIHRHGLEGRVVWAGERQDMAAVYSALDAVCSSSRVEGFPNVVAEAMSCGIPCAVTDAGDSAWIVGDPALVAPVGDADALARALLVALKAPRDPGPRRQRIVELFGVEAMTDATLEALGMTPPVASSTSSGDRALHTVS